MKSQELRIGSLYKAPLEFFKGSIEAKLMSEDECFVLTESKMVLLFQFDLLTLVQPVPITEKWLLKFGFDKEKFTKYIGKDAGSLWEISVLTNSENEVWAWNMDREMVCFLGKCEHVHQLQNLYFALTGQELTQK